MRRSVLLLASLLSLSLVGCVSTSTHERVERELSLAQIAKQNAQRNQATAEKELAEAKAQIAELERQLSSTMTAADDKTKATADLQKELTAERTRSSQAEARLAALRAAIAKLKLRPADREGLLKELGPEPITH